MVHEEEKNVSEGEEEVAFILGICISGLSVAFEWVS